MPIPITKDVGSTVKFLKREKPGMAQRQKVAIGLNIARKAGANIPKKPGNPHPIAEVINNRARGITRARDVGGSALARGVRGKLPIPTPIPRRRRREGEIVLPFERGQRLV